MSGLQTLETAEATRAWAIQQRCAGKSIGFVPTMGALHEGHGSLIRASVANNDVTIVSIFVNPAQFGPNEDLAKYPRTFDADRSLCEELGADAIYAPRSASMYAANHATFVNVERLSTHLCGASRPVFFRGIATVVTKLFNVVSPDRAYFGLKDAQQCAVIKRMVRDLDYSIEIVEMPIVREPDGLAMSSRNAYLSSRDRERALCLSKSLIEASNLFAEGERDANNIKRFVREQLSGVDIDYVEVVDACEIQPVDRIEGKVILAVGAWLNQTRLIDNIHLDPDSKVNSTANS
ncbi:MAG: pantothenate synthetase [Candidatus Hydrogenedentota bacterium]